MRVLLGRTLAGLRKAKRFPQEIIADKMAVSRPTYAGWEKDRGCPSFIQIYMLISFYNISMQEWMQLVENDNFKHPVDSSENLSLSSVKTFI